MSNNRVAATNPDQDTSLVQAFDPAYGILVMAANGAISIKEGTVLITKTTAAALTLVAPTAGLPAAGGDDGKQLRITAATAHAHTVTTPADAINGADDTVTYAAVGDTVLLTAYNGVWYATLGGPTPAALSEV
jgi:hypothetical protein